MQFNKIFLSVPWCYPMCAFKVKKGLLSTKLH
jgi:hypothetical protein